MAETPTQPAAPDKAPPAPAEPEKPKAAAKALGRLKKAGGPFKSLGELFKDLVDPDPPTRKMALYFLLSITGIVVVLATGGVYFAHLRQKLTAELSDTGEQGKNLGEFIKKRAEDAKKKFSSQSLGTFTIQLTNPQNKDKNAKPPPGVMNLAEIEIVVDCEDKDTCDFLEERMPQVRDQVSSLFTAMDREELMSRGGKQRLKQQIISKLNLWLPKGKIENLYFNKLVIS